MAGEFFTRCGAEEIGEGRERHQWFGAQEFVDWRSVIGIADLPGSGVDAVASDDQRDGGGDGADGYGG